MAKSGGAMATAHPYEVTLARFKLAREAGHELGCATLFARCDSVSLIEHCYCRILLDRRRENPGVPARLPLSLRTPLERARRSRAERMQRSRHIAGWGSGGRAAVVG